MTPQSHIVMYASSPKYHNVYGEESRACGDNRTMSDEGINEGPNYVAAWRMHRGLTQEQLAEAIGTSQNMVGYLESAKRGLTAKWLRRIARALNTTPGLLLDHAPSAVPSELVQEWVGANEDQRAQIIGVVQALNTKRKAS